MEETISIQNIIILGIAIWVGYNLPSWSKKFVPGGIGKWAVPSPVKIVLQYVIAYIFAKYGWGKIASSVDIALSNLKSIAAIKQVENILKIPTIILAIGAIVITLWIIKVVFESLSEAKSFTDSLLAFAILIILFSGYNWLWTKLSEYILLNITGAEKLFATEAWKEIKTFFDAEP